MITVALTSALVNQVLFPSPVFDPLYRATRGLISATLQANAVSFLIVVGLVLFWLGKVRPWDVGLVREQLPHAAVVILGVWLLAQGIAVVVSAATGAVAVDPVWAKRGWTVVIGLLIGQLFGNALVEEIEYRGFLLPQLYLKLHVVSPRLRTAVAVVAAVALFSLSHIPNQLTPTDIALNVLIAAGWGVFLSAIYLATGNLFIAVGVHALINAPTLIFASTVVPQVPVALAAVIVITAEWWLWRPSRSHNQAAASKVALRSRCRKERSKHD